MFAHLCGTDGPDTRLYRVTFRQLDRQGTGAISATDLIQAIRERGLAIPDDFESRVVPYLDSNASEGIDFIEYLAATIDVQKVRLIMSFTTKVSRSTHEDPSSS